MPLTPPAPPSARVPSPPRSAKAAWTSEDAMSNPAQRLRSNVHAEPLGRLGRLIRSGDVAPSPTGSLSCCRVFHAAQRGGPRNWDSLPRWDPDQGEGVWNATAETELSC